MTVKRQPLDSSAHFDVTKHIKLVPPFQEKKVDKYFLHFKKVAENLKWPKEHWTLLLQSVIKLQAMHHAPPLQCIKQVTKKNTKMCKLKMQ